MTKAQFRISLRAWYFQASAIAEALTAMPSNLEANALGHKPEHVLAALPGLLLCLRLFKIWNWRGSSSKVSPAGGSAGGGTGAGGSGGGQSGQGGQGVSGGDGAGGGKQPTNQGSELADSLSPEERKKLIRDF